MAGGKLLGAVAKTGAQFWEWGSPVARVTSAVQSSSLLGLRIEVGHPQASLSPGFGDQK